MFSKIFEVKEGTILIADEGFTCIPSYQECEVKSHPNGLYVECEEGQHFLDGQIDFESKTTYIGFHIEKEEYFAD